MTESVVIAFTFLLNDRNYLAELEAIITSTLQDYNIKVEVYSSARISKNELGVAVVCRCDFISPATRQTIRGCIYLLARQYSHRIKNFSFLSLG